MSSSNTKLTGTLSSAISQISLQLSESLGVTEANIAAETFRHRSAVSTVHRAAGLSGNNYVAVDTDIYFVSPRRFCLFPGLPVHLKNLGSAEEEVYMCLTTNNRCCSDLKLGKVQTFLILR